MKFLLLHPLLFPIDLAITQPTQFLLVGIEFLEFVRKNFSLFFVRPVLMVRTMVSKKFYGKLPSLPDVQAPVAIRR
jgi:hypothetical protein